MAFQQTSRDIALQGSNTLTAQCKTTAGNYIPASIDLDTCLGNINGAFVWGKQAFSKTASGVKLDTSNVVGLEAMLQDSNGSPRPAAVDLSACIANMNGQLVYKP